MNVCVTGALGHIGSALIRELALQSGDTLYMVDNLLTQRYASLFDLPPSHRYVFRQADILTDNLDDIIRNSDVMVHLAAVTDAETSFHRRDEVETVNKKGLERVANLCAEHDCALIFPSSTSVYGVQEGVVDENCPAEDLKPQSPYADSKLYGERLLTDLRRQKNLRFVTFRLGTIFGYSVGMRFHTAVNKFIWQAVNGQAISVWRTALHQKRPYCSLKDCLGAISHVIRNDLFDGELFNIVTTNLTVNDIVETIRGFVPGLTVEQVDSPIMNQLSYTVSSDKSLRAGFTYRGDVHEDIAETIRHLQAVNNSSVRITL